MAESLCSVRLAASVSTFKEVADVPFKYSEITAKITNIQQNDGGELTQNKNQSEGSDRLRSWSLDDDNGSCLQHIRSGHV